MTPLQTTALIVHVMTGLLAVAGSYAVWMQLLKTQLNQAAIRSWTYFAVMMTMVSWISAAWYYVTFYGRNVRPIIVNGPYPWGHEVFMEWKEHIFLFLPFLSLLLLFATWKLESGSPAAEARRRAASVLAAVMTVIGIIVTLSGVAASGAVRFGN